ncbi:MAG: chemotaxis protein CheW [Sulfurifustaceae bacterium]
MQTNQPIANPAGSSASGAEPATESTLATRNARFDAEPSEVAAGADASQYMGFRIGSLGLLLPVDDGREVIAPPPVARLPHAASWLRGLANVRGTLVPVIDGAAALGITRQAGTATYLLIFGEGETASGLLIDGLPRLLDVASLKRRPDLSGIPSRLVESVTAAYEDEGVAWLAVDLGSLFDTLAREIAPNSVNPGSGLN